MRMNEHGFGRKGLRQNFRTYEPGLSDSFAHCFKRSQLQQETQAIDDVVVFIDLLQTPHIYTHFADILTRLSNLRLNFLSFNLKKYNLMKHNLLRIIYLKKQFIQNLRSFCTILQ